MASAKLHVRDTNAAEESRCSGTGGDRRKVYKSHYPKVQALLTQQKS